MSIPAGPTFDAFKALIDPSNLDPSNPAKSSGVQSSFHCAHCRKFRAVACGTMAFTLIASFHFWGSRAA
jgi:hypothetical protein